MRSLVALEMMEKIVMQVSRSKSDMSCSAISKISVTDDSRLEPDYYIGVACLRSDLTSGSPDSQRLNNHWMTA